MICMASSLPRESEDWYVTLPNPPAEVSKDTSDLWSASKLKVIRPHCADDADADGLVALSKKLLALDPIARPTR